MKKFKQVILCASMVVLSIAAVGCNSQTNAKENTTQADTAKTDDKKTDDKKTGEVVAKVGKSTITEDQVAAEMSYIEQMLVMQFGEAYKENEEAMKVYNEQRQQVIDYLIEIEVVMQEAKAKGIETPADEIEKQLATMKTQFETEEAFNEALNAQNTTLDEFKERLAQSLRVNKMVTEVTKDVKVDDKEVEKYYKDNIANYTVEAGANIAHILVKTEEEAKTVKKEYDGGKTFEELAKKYGTDGTKDTGGLLEFIPYNSTKYDADFLAGAKALKEGEVSAPVKTQFGWHLIKVTGVKNEAVIKPLSEVSEEAKTKALETKKGEVFNTYLQGLKDKAKIEIIEKK